MAAELEYIKVNNRFGYYKSSTEKNGRDTFINEIHEGLNKEQKSLPPKYFYDDIGSDLFEKICITPEYYVTRTENSILENYSNEIALNCNGIDIITELGSGNSVKTRNILKAFLGLNKNLTYIPIDVSDILISSGITLTEKFSSLIVKGVIGEYEESLEFISGKYNDPRLILFLGSSIGNFDPEYAELFLAKIAGNMRSGDKILIGFDMVKDEGVLNAAYNDSAGVTAEFNLNLLRRINRELNADFDLKNFAHKAFFNPGQSRIEMHLVSLIKAECKS
ncbi:MAG: Histidine-specific methyltransferase EgtD [Chlorobi bacterium OLB5]|nr:MAG: Histidine-specific methyltransferase EgtD [Chlorobi bacterium OLB5]